MAKLGGHLADRARPKRPFFASSPITLEKNRSEKKSRSKFLKGKFLSFYKALVEKNIIFDLQCVFVTLLIIKVKLITIITSYKYDLYSVLSCF